MKKSFVWLLTFLLLFPLMTPAEKAASKEPDVYDIYDLSGENALWTGVAVPLASGVLLTSAASLPEKTEFTGLSDGSSLLSVRRILRMEKGHTAFVFYDAEKIPSAAVPWPLTKRSELWKSQDLYVYHVSATGDQLYRSVSSGAPLIWEGLDSMVVTLSGQANPGDPVLTDGGELAGMITAEYAEGMCRYVAVTAQGILNLMYQMYAMPDDGWTDNPEEGFAVTVNGNQVTFDWAGIQTEVPEGERRWLVVLDTANNYLNYFPADKELTSCTMLLTPGRTYLSGMTVSEGTPTTLPERYAVTGLPEAELLSEHHFRPVTTTLAVSGDGESITTRIQEPLREITVEELRSGKIHFYSWSVYTVTEKMEDTLLITLTMPDGINYQYTSGWIYDPEYMAEDIWSVSLDAMGFLNDLEKRGYPAGTCRMAFYIGGKLADSFSFEIR